MKGALIYGRSPYLPLRCASLVRSPRGRALPLHPGGGLCPLHSRHITPRIREWESHTGGLPFQTRGVIRGFAPAPHPQRIFTIKSTPGLPRPWYGFDQMHRCYAQRTSSCRRWLPTKFHLDGVKACSLNNPQLPKAVIPLRWDSSFMAGIDNCFKEVIQSAYLSLFHKTDQPIRRKIRCCIGSIPVR